MNYKEYKELKKERNYNSSAAEYKRNLTVSKKLVFPNIKKEEMFEYVLKTYFKEQKVSEDDSMVVFNGKNIGTENKPIFIDGYEEDKKFEVHYIAEKQFNMVRYVFNQTRFNTVIKFTKSIKIPDTRVGLNGTLGTWKFKREVSKEVRQLELHLKNKFNVK